MQLEERKKRQADYDNLEKSYNERRRQMEREKELERIKNEKRVL